MDSKISYCGKLIRAQDPDRFLISLMAPSDPPLSEGSGVTSRREALWALFAFNYEIAKTREVVSETTLGLMRLQWWRDAIKAIYEDNIVLEHEVVMPLAEAIKAYNLPREDFDKLCYAREFDLEGVAPSDTTGLLNYLDYTNTPLLKQAIRICGDDPESEAVQSVAINYGLVGIVRAIVHHARQGRCYLPSSLMHAHNISEDELFALKKPDEVSHIVKALDEEFVGGVKSDNTVLKASQKLAEIYCKQLKLLSYNVMQPRALLPPHFKELRLMLATKFL